jgi:LysM repeat protein
MMRFATLSRMERPRANALGSWTTLPCRIVTGILVICTLLYLFTPGIARAQSDSGPEDTPVEAIPDQVVPLEDASEDIIHEIAVGDNLTNVAQRYNVKPADLAAYNQILDFNHVVIGQKLRIPPVGMTITEPAQAIQEAVPGFDGYHVVRIGESLGAIARQYNMTMEELMALNDITEPNIIRMGTMLRLREDIAPPKNATQPELDEVIHEVERGESLSEIAAAYSTTVEQIMVDNDLTSEEVRVGQELSILPPTDASVAFGVDAPLDGERRIVIDLSEQTLSAYQGDVRVLFSIVSTGKAATPTRPGEFAIYQKLKAQDMSGDDYNLPGVPWVMYYDGENAIHGAYWHANFGIPTSHGCTNMTIGEARALYSWAPEGTPVTVQE